MIEESLPEPTIVMNNCLERPRSNTHNVSHVNTLIKTKAPNVRTHKRLF